MLSSEGEERNANRTPLIIVLASIVVVGLLAGGAYFLFFRSGDEEQTANASSTSDSDDSEQAPDEPGPDHEAEPEPDDPQPPDDEPAPDEDREQPDGEEPDDNAPAPNPDPNAGPALTYDSLGGGWEQAELSLFPTETGQRVLTEPEYAPGKDWQAIIAAGRARPEWVVPGDPKATANRTSEWFAADGFGDADVTPETTDEGPLEIDGYDAYVLEQHFAYSLPNLKAKGETVYIVAVDFGDTAGLFVASIPDTHPELVEDADVARDSLTVTE